MMEAESYFSNLPSELILKIFSHLDYKDLVNCSYQSRRLGDLSNHDVLWRRLCNRYWLETKCCPFRTWKERFQWWYLDMGQYIHYYASIRRAWDKILQFVEIHCPVIHKTIKNGCSEEDLNEAERTMGLKLPPDMRCSYRIHNGQRLTSPGLMGSMSIHSHYRSESLLDLDTVMAGYRYRDGLRGCAPLTFCLHSGLTQFLAVTDEDGYERNTVFYPSQNIVDEGSVGIDSFITGSSFEEWLTTYANHLESNDFVILHDQPFRFLHEPSCEETTDYITVSVATCFLPELSTVSPPSFFYTYRITMSMSSDAPQHETCQLETRHWLIMDETGLEELVNGPGVVGEYPVMYPGASFSWISCTTFSTTYGNMRGHFKMRNLMTGDRTEVQCPIFHMRCQPYITSLEREATKKQKNKKN